MAKVIRRFILIFKALIIINLFSESAKALEIIRDTELELFTNELISNLLNSDEIVENDLNIYFIKSNQVNAFVTGGKNMFINTEIIIRSEDYREYAAVLAHELAHIQGGHIFNTSIEMANLSGKAFPIYLLGVIGLMTGAAETGFAGVMLGQASVNDGFMYYSRTQEASADQAAVNILCKNGIDGKYLANFLDKLEDNENMKISDNKNYRSTHPLTENRITWINSSLKNYGKCNFTEDEKLSKRFELLKAKLHGFTHSHLETEALYNSDRDIDLYATAVSSYFKGNHKKSLENLTKLINEFPRNPYYKELIGEIYFVNNDYKNAYNFQKDAIEEISHVNDLYYMMIGNYLLSHEEYENTINGINYLKKSLQINPKNAYSWYLLARAYGQIDQIPLANYATAERYFLIGERALSYEFALKAAKKIEQNTPEWYRSSDLINILENETSTNRQ